MMKHLNRLVFFGVLLAVLAALFITAHMAQAAPLAHELMHASVPSSGCAPGSSILSAVTAPSKRDAWAVGYCLKSNSTGNQTLTQHWNGSQWTVIPSPNAPAASNLLFAATTFSSKNVWAVGYSFSNGGSQTLTEHWNGSQWSIIPSPNVPLMTDSELFAVAAISSNDVWAVGYSFNNSGTQTLTEHWNGSHWSIVTSPNISSARNELLSVAAISSNDVWAVGRAFTGTSLLTVTEHWNGSQWSIIPSPNVPPGFNELVSVTALSSKNVWAVGDALTTNNVNQTLTEHWNGSHWSIVESPNVPSMPINLLKAVAARSSTDIWAVGFFSANGATEAQTLTEHWNGSQWSIVTSPNAASMPINPLQAVVARSCNDAWAVGYSSSNRNGDQTLIEHWNGSSWTIIPSSSSSPQRRAATGHTTQ